MELNFDYFYRKYKPALVYFSFQIINDKELAEDCVQEAFIKMYSDNYIEKFKKRYYEVKECVVKSWLYICVKNKSINKINMEHRRLNRDNIIAEHLPLFEKGDFLNEMIRAERARDMSEAIQTLPTECKKVITGLYIEGKKVKEVSDELGVAISTVKNQKFYGIDELQGVVLITEGIRKRDKLKTGGAPTPASKPKLDWRKIARYAMLVDYKEKQKHRTGPKPKIDYPILIELRKTLKPKQIAEKFGVSVLAVYKAIQRSKQFELI